MTPMLDIVFIMLIFFIVSTSFLKSTGIEAQRPQASNTNNATAPAIAINIDAQGQTTVNGRLVDISRIPANLERLLSQNNHTKVLVDAHTNTSHQHVVSVLDQIKTIEELSIAIVSKTTNS